jgi:transcriptional regulator with XRE-family HTH domain
MSDFGAELERLMRARGLGVRALHRRSGYSAGYITQLRQGRRNPSPETARDLDDALDAGGALAARVHAPSMRAKSAEPAVFGPVPEPSLLGLEAWRGIPRAAKTFDPHEAARV